MVKRKDSHADPGLGDTVAQLVRLLEARARKAKVTREQYVAGMVNGTYPPLPLGRAQRRQVLGHHAAVEHAHVETYFVTATVGVSVTLSDGTRFSTRRRIRLGREKHDARSAP